MGRGVVSGEGGWLVGRGVVSGEGGVRGEGGWLHSKVWTDAHMNTKGF